MWSVPSSGYRRYLPHQGWRGSSLWCNDCSCGPLILSPASPPAFRGLEFCGSHSFAASAWFRFFLLQGRLGTIEKNDYNADKKCPDLCVTTVCSTTENKPKSNCFNICRGIYLLHRRYLHETDTTMGISHVRCDLTRMTRRQKHHNKPCYESLYQVSVQAQKKIENNH